MSSALRSGRTLNAMMIAFDADASSTSDSFTAPTPAWMIRILTFSSVSLASVSASTSAEPCTSALMMIGSSFMPPSAICACSDSSVEPRALRAERARLRLLLAERRDLPRLGRVRAPGTRRPAAAGRPGRALRPASTARPTSSASPRSSMSARTRPTIGPAMNVSPTLSVPSCTSTVATGPRPFVELRFEHGARRAALRVGLELADVADEQDHLEQQRRCSVFFCADTSTVTVWPPHSSGIRPSSVSSRFDPSRAGVRLVDLVDRDDDRHVRPPWRDRSLRCVCGMTPSSAATTSTTMSVTLRAAGAHQRERLVARRVEEHDVAAR